MGKSKLTVGVVGVGVVGGALAKYLEAMGHEVLKDDPDKGFHNAFTDEAQQHVDAIFLCVPVPTIAEGNDSGRQDTTILKAALKKYVTRKTTPFFIRSSVLPKTCDHLRKYLKLQIWALPEFLTERSAEECFRRQGIICGSPMDNREAFEEHQALLREVFADKREQLFFMTNREAELAKYAHNCMGAVKVNFFNLIAKYAETISADYEAVRQAVLMTGYINAEHTLVPGPDGKHGFGGTCFPKDLRAFVRELQRLGLQSGSCELTFYENFCYRIDWDKQMPVPQVHFPKEKK